ncbi:hypothetical protein LTR09_004826 [Extremus antarcticus]|uniref:Cytochrome P450 n=1 Tax=Extremus antarcticus TaxID=702011 RepID=A0AAJ0DP84_9PEZI|nr:hypothetical protein LTR09_004826 [Extremus antarcticus]
MVPAWLILMFALVTLYIARSIRTFIALRHFGGHWSSGWSRLWLLKTQGSGEMNKRFTTITDEYGSTARIGPSMLITADPELIRRMSAVRSPFTRGPWYAALKLHPERENVVSIRDEHIHNDLRSRMAFGYAGKENEHLEQDVDDQLLKLFELLNSKYVTQPEKGVFVTVDLSQVTNYFTLDVISKVAFGQTFGFLERDEDPFGYLKNLEQFLPAIIVFGVYTELTSILKMPLMKSALPKSTDKRGLGRVMGFARDRVQERFGQKGIVRNDMLGSFIKHGLTQGELESETLTQITAGSDSTASSLRLTLHFICTSPPILERLLAEVNSAIEAGKISRPVIKDSEARELSYLQACIKEGLRVYPPVTGLMAKLAPEGGVTVDVDGTQKYIPAGTQIGWNSWGMMRQQDIFGPDCEIYRPERWLPKDGGEEEQRRISRMTETVGLCFGYGKYGCLGRGVATMELNKAVIETLLRFNLQPCSLSKPFNESAVGFYIHTDMNFVVTKRHNDAEKAAAAGKDEFAFDAGAL